MRRRDFIIFFSIVLSVYSLINYYVILRGWEALPPDPLLRLLYLVVSILLAASFLSGRFLERRRSSVFSTFLITTGSYWLAAMTYFFLLAASFDLLKAIASLTGVVAPVGWMEIHAAAPWILLVSILVVGITVFLGARNARTPRVRNMEFVLHKNGAARRELKVVAASDIHLGTIIGKKRLEKIVQQINALDPDIVLLPGDVVDEDIGPVIRDNLGETLRKIRHRLGIYAITGNHEYIGGADAACRYLEEHGITLLRDRSVQIDGGWTLIGREDRSVSQFAGRKRKPLAELLDGVDRGKPVILMDHQPFGLEEAEREGVDMQISGHTHHGQLWPFNFITRKVYEVSWGYKQKGNTHVYVSCGVGTWGPPVRTGNTPEILSIRLLLDGGRA